MKTKETLSLSLSDGKNQGSIHVPSAEIEVGKRIKNQNALDLVCATFLYIGISEFGASECL